MKTPEQLMGAIRNISVSRSLHPQEGHPAEHHHVGCGEIKFYSTNIINGFSGSRFITGRLFHWLDSFSNNQQLLEEYHQQNRQTRLTTDEFYDTFNARISR